jgi:hypothetical protein
LTTLRRILLTALLLISGLSVLGNQLTHAQETREGIGISPTSLTLSADAGQELTGKVTVLNPGEKTINYRLYASNFSIRNENYEKDFDRHDIKTSQPVGWFSLPNEPRQLQPQGQEQVTYKIKIPRGVASQGYYGVIFAETIAAEADTTGVERRKRVGALVYLTVNGDELRQSGQLLDFTTPLWLRNGTSIPVKLRFQNNGNVHFPLTGQIRLKNVLGRIVNSTEVNSIILPDTTRQLSFELPTGQPVGMYKLDGDINYLEQSTFLGSKWVLVAAPLWLGLWLAGILLLIVMIILMIGRRGKRS